MHKTTQEDSTAVHEWASALADGELQGGEFAQALEALETDEEARARWHTYHLVGDVLRSGAGAAVRPHDAAFVARLRQRLRDERIAPRPAAARRLPAPRRHSANDGLWRWKLAAGLSSLAAVAVLGWQFAAALRDEGAGAQLARAQAPGAVLSQPTELASAEPPVMIRDPQLDQFIAAHQQQGGASVLQMSAGFLRNATFERPAR